MLDKDKVIGLIRAKGPIVPGQLTKELGETTIIIGAVLSELVHNKQVLISHTKVGGSPLYYLPGQRSRLQEFSGYLNEKDKKAYDILKEGKVLWDRELTPLMRVAMRSIRDFAKPVKASVRGNSELFWQWYLFPDGEVLPNIRKILQQHYKHKPVAKPTPAQVAQIKPIPAESAVGVPEQKQDMPHPKAKPKSRFEEDVRGFLEKRGIKIKEIKAVRKNTEVECIVEVPTAVGNLEYYCRAKSKKRISEGDLAPAYIKGQAEKLPVLFLVTGEMTKKAKASLSKEFKNLKVKHIL